ncbi:MAG: flagellar motor protein MotB [Bdellovibrionales bacterium]
MADNKPIIIIKKIKKVEGGHHGGAWKVAYADFVTAMMAFFLLLWLLNVTTDVQRKGIADYFSPASISKSQSGAGGIFGGRVISAPEAKFSDSAPPGMDTLDAPPPGYQAKDEDVDEGRMGKPGNMADGDQAGEGDKDNVGTGMAAQGEQPTGVVAQQGGNPDEAMSQEQIDALDKARAEEEEQKFKLAEKALNNAIGATPELAPLAKSLIVDQTEEGLRIQIVDQENYSMFPSGSAQMYPQTRRLLELVGKAVALLPNKLSITGHTDNAPFASSSMRDNWDLSAERANASRRVLTGMGIAEDRIQTVVGLADREPYVKENPADPKNRRISIVLIRQSITGTADTPATPAGPDERQQQP